jgi:hypothetical protein
MALSGQAPPPSPCGLHQATARRPLNGIFQLRDSLSADSLDWPRRIEGRLFLCGDGPARRPEERDQLRRERPLEAVRIP